MKKIVSLLLAISMCITGVFTAFAETKLKPEAVEEAVYLFEDVASSWAREEIEELAKSGIINGVSDTEFAPDREISRAEFLAMMFRTLKLSPVKYEMIYPDVSKDDWFADKLQVMYELGLVNKEAFSGEFDANKPINREEMASLLSSGVALYVKEEKAEETAKEPIKAIEKAEGKIAYKDENNFSEWAKEAVMHVSELGIMRGKEENSFDAKGKATRAETAAVVKRVMDVFEAEGFDTSKMPWKQAPVIYKVSDEIAPGETFNIYGCGLTKNTKVYIEDAKTAGDEPNEETPVLMPILFDEAESYVSVILPETYEGKVYKIWTENEYGKSDGLNLNSARLFWVGGSDITWAGQTVQVIGTGFMLDRIGGENNTKVKLTVDGEDYFPEITSLEPYSIKFTVPKGIKTGEYKLSVANDGKNWDTLDFEQKLYIVEKGNDPYNLGFAWADNYIYDNKINAKDYGANGDGVADDTAAIQKALDALHEEGGGVLYLPNGTYRVSMLALGGKTIIEGESREETKLSYCGTDTGAAWIYSGANSYTIGYQGLTNLTLTKSPETTKFQYPDSLLWIGMNWEAKTVHVQSNRTFSGFFMKGITWDFPVEVIEAGRALNQVVAKKYFLYEDISGKGYHTGFMPTYAYYSTIRNTNQKPVNSTNESVGPYTVYENNTIDMQSSHTKDSGDYVYAQGIFLRSHAYIAHNKILNTGTPGLANNDGEIFATENVNGGTIRASAYVERATLNNIYATAQPDSSGEAPIAYGFYNVEGFENESRFHQYYAMIVEGKGIGQYKRVADFDVDGLNISVKLSEPWDIVPDKTSRMVLTTTCAETIYYDNYAENCEKGMWFYGGQVDSIVDGNVGINVEGAQSFAFDIESNGRRTGNYFVVHKNNRYEGSSKLGSVCNIANMIGIEIRSSSGDAFGIMSYGGEIKRNYMKGALTSASSIKNTETSAYNGIIWAYNVPNNAQYNLPKRVVITGGIIEDNTLVNMKEGITVGAGYKAKVGDSLASGVVIKDNSFTNVKSHILINGKVENVVRINN